MCSIKKLLLKYSQYSQGNICVGLAQVFSYEYCKIFKDTYFEEHLRTAVSASTKTYQVKGNNLKIKSNDISNRGTVYLKVH